MGFAAVKRQLAQSALLFRYERVFFRGAADILNRYHRPIRAMASLRAVTSRADW